MTAAIDADRITVRAGGKTLLEAVSCSFVQGESVAIAGPNGAGKSTLLRTLSGEITPGAGAVRIKGRPIGEFGSRRLAMHRAILSQSITVAFPFTVREVVRMGAGERRGAEVDRLADELMAEVDLDGFQDRVVTTLSGGEQARAHLARVLLQVTCGERVNGPGILMLDEPTASLDLRHQLDIVASVRRRASNGTTVVAVLHDLNLATLLGGRVIVMAEAKIVADGSASATIADGVVARSFGVEQAVCRVPEAGQPFVLPHAARRAT